MVEELTIFSQNCRGGLSVAAKRRDLFQYVRSKHFDIICLQDTHINPKLDSFIKSEWGFEAYFSSYTTNSRGVMVLLNNTFEHKVNRVKTDKNGNFIILELNIDGKNITLVNLYGPNEDKPEFYENIKMKLADFENEEVIMCGDWNLCLDAEKDCENYLHINNPRARNIVLNLLDENGFKDPWRIMNENVRKYTWRRLNPTRKQSRLDFFLVHESIFQFVTDANITSGYRTDHSAITLKLKFQESARGKGYWKFNNSLLKDKLYVDEVKKVIEEVKQTYAINLQGEINIPNEDVIFNINDQLFLETLLVIIRGHTIKYSSFKKKQFLAEEKKLEEEILDLETRINDNLCNVTDQTIQTLSQKKIRLTEIRKTKIDGVMLRSRTRYQDLGEKPTKYFFGLENRQYTNKVMNKIIDSNAVEHTDTKDILNCQKQFYENLYDKVPVSENNSLTDILGENEDKLSDEEAHALEGKITYAELLHALKQMKNEKSPGLDGYTAEFFKFFWIDLGIFVLRSINYGYEKGSLSITQKQGVITCLPKQDKDRNYLKNWRPISLLNVVYKLASSAIANRIKTVLDSLIHEDQKGFISGRCIAENVRLIYDVLFETKNQELPGLILSVDFEKAFDTVSWEFIENVLKYFNFGPSIISWIKLFQSGSESCIIQNGFMSDFLKLKRGCRQGDPVSPYVFILCAEILGKMLRTNKNVKGININGNDFLLSQYADDTQIFLDGTEQSLREALSVLDRFYAISGLKINIEKTKAIWIGSLKNSEVRICRNYNLDWTEGYFKILGVTFTTEVFDIWDVNIPPIISKVQSLLQQWSKRRLTLFGRITVIKSLALSKFIHLFLALPNPPGELIKRLDILFFKFLWNSGPDRVKRSIIIKDLSAGGLRMVNINVFIKSLKITWLRRVIQNSKNVSWYTLSGIDFQKLFKFGMGYAKRFKQNLQNPFWKDVLQNWADFCKDVKIDSINQILDSPLWYNENLLNGTDFCIRDWHDKGIILVSDIIDEEGNIYQFEALKTKYNLRGTYLDFQAFIRRIPEVWKNEINYNRLVCILSKYDVRCNVYVQYLLKDKKGCRRMYDVMVPTKSIQESSRWERDIGYITEAEVKAYNSVISTLKEIKLRDFQYKITNRILVTKSFLYRIRKVDDNQCEYCRQNSETIIHLFVQCNQVKSFWRELDDWLSNNFGYRMSLNDKNILFSFGQKNKLINYLCVLAKYYVYSNKFSGRGLNLEAFMSILKRKYQSEKYLANLSNTFAKFLRKWAMLYNYFERD